MSAYRPTDIRIVAALVVVLLVVLVGATCSCDGLETVRRQSSVG